MSYAKELDQLSRVETLNSLEFRVQFSAVLLCTATAILATGLWLLAIWFIVHYSLVFCERFLAAKFSQHDSASAFFTVLAFNLAIGITFAWLPVYLWAQHHPSFYFAAMALLVGSTLNTFLIRSSLWYQAICYVAPNAGAFLVIAVTMSGQNLSIAEQVTLVAIACSILIYFLISIVEMHRMHTSHEQTRIQLLQSQKSEVIGQLTGGVAHDFNNLLGVVSGYLEIALSENGQSERDVAIRGALGATTKGATLVHQLLAFARKARLESRSIPVETALNDLEEMARRVMPSNIRIEFADSGPSLRVLADPALLTTALLNLMLNSRDAISGNGTIELSASAAKVDELPKGLSVEKKHAQFILFSVTDTGKGISKENLERATEPFFTTKPVGFGSGLGLSMVQGFARQSGGDIHITSQVGTGTTVLLALPMGSEPEELVATPVLEEVLPDVTGQVLVVEDQPELLQMITRLMKSIGFTPFSASTADAACELIDSGLTPSLLITDAVMPGSLQMPDLLRRVRSLQPMPKVIVMSGYDEQEIDPRALGLVDFSFIQKPFAFSKLSALVGEKFREPVN